MTTGTRTIASSKRPDSLASPLVLAMAMGWLLLTFTATYAVDVRVTVSNNAPTGGVFITPVWVGFHDGGFDSYDGGLSTQPGLERIAEDGDISAISADFAAGLTYIDRSGVSPVSATIDSGQSGSARVQGAIFGAAGPLAPGETSSEMFSIDPTGANQYFSYVSMVVPSNDYYVANGNPLAHDLMSFSSAPIGASTSFNIGMPGSVNDAGTEVNFANISGAGDTEDDSVAALGLLGMSYVGQSVPNTGADENGVNMNVGSAYGEAPSILAAHPNLDFNNGPLYPNGIGTVTLTVVPEPSSAMLILVASAGIGTFVTRRRRIP